MIQILEENEFFIVLNKPAGYSVHNQNPSVADFLKKSNKPLHFVNRLDQETSGLLLVALKPELHTELVESMQSGKKFYRALLRGEWKQPTQQTETEQTEWTWPLTDKAEGRQNPQGAASERKACATRVQRVRSSRYFTEIEVELLTGRQHQIRKHAALAKQPIVGDSRYNDKKYNDNISSRYGESRMHLHAEKLEFVFRTKNYKLSSPYNLDRYFHT
ncbi:RluA family pseudouridine synthase [Pseudobdellovibrio exovorus]|uniref:Pseudouridine synthase Rlu family protein n=1 Tax=Pseudobdellovibrio exovorus JSS TaxID=1184267 RepID=M4V8V4_9BACT|nr:RNA pseudouridine synthase [Pseudobdellovibrio exovorus]AGH95837.1 pseudouridine synthase Rlu family protein [Pseudobdellovibrio exovorus JSS]